MENCKNAAAYDGVERFTTPADQSLPTGALVASLCATGLVVAFAWLVWTGRLGLNKK